MWLEFGWSMLLVMSDYIKNFEFEKFKFKMVLIVKCGLHKTFNSFQSSIRGLSMTATRFNKTLDDVLYPDLEASKTGMLKVSDLHTVYWEECGNPAGLPVMVLHGGPGGGSQADYRRG